MNKSVSYATFILGRYWKEHRSASLGTDYKLAFGLTWKIASKSLNDATKLMTKTSKDKNEVNLLSNKTNNLKKCCYY